jgi:hypothetical protein
MRATLPSCITVLFALACSQEGAPPPPAAGAGSSTGGSGQTTGGSTSTTTGGTGSTPSYSGAPPVYASYGGSDSGGLFGPNAVPFDPNAIGGSGGSGGGSGGSGGSGPPGDGNVAICTFRTGISGTVTFTQTGTDVEAVVDITGNCPDGDNVITIHDGYSCDNADTEGVPWGARGEMGTVSCSGGKATATFNRSGSDSNTNWTVADHNLDSDISGHVLIVTPAGDSANRVACGNFF